MTPPRRWRRVAAALLMVSGLATAPAVAAEKVVIDLDIGDDVDDAFALALALVSPEIDVIGITTAWGDTALRVRLVHRLLHEIGRDDVPVAQGIATAGATPFSQARWARRWPADDRPPTGAVDLLLELVARHPGEVTLLALGPLTNVAAALQRDPARFRQLNRIAMMGGSIRRGYGRSQYAPPSAAAREYNVAADPAAARSLLASGVAIDLFPLDATLVRLDDVRRDELFAHGSALTDALTSLYHQWSSADQPWASAIPTLFDVVPVAAVIDRSLCPTTPMAVIVGDDGSTTEAAGPPNVRVCLRSDRERVLDLLMRRLLAEPGPPGPAARGG